ncbi:MAG: urease alpha subunit [Paraglaciecola sp.]|jgi:urease alpha subunit
MTINAAWQLNMETKIGSVEVGKLADFTLITLINFQHSSGQTLKCQVYGLQVKKILKRSVISNKVGGMSWLTVTPLVIFFLFHRIKSLTHISNNILNIFNTDRYSD